MKLQNILSAFIFCALLLTSCEGRSQTKNTVKAVKSKEVIANKSTKVTYKLKGFKQSCCTGIVKFSLKEVGGFIKSEANIKNQELTVWFDKTKSTEEDIKKAINKTPYKIEKTL